MVVTFPTGDITTEQNEGLPDRINRDKNRQRVCRCIADKTSYNRTSGHVDQATIQGLHCSGSNPAFLFGGHSIFFR
jgi:hypothetical protein